MKRRTSITVLSALALAATASLLLAGPLNPPAGPVAPTPGPEPRIAINETNTPGDADSLFKITQPGSYYLIGNINGVANKHGIEIAASGVTIDLNGFDLAGVANMGAFDAVTATNSGLSNIEVRNGSIRDWGGDGVDLLTAQVVNCTFRDLRSSGNAGRGIAAGVTSIISGCTAHSNEGSGIVTNASANITACNAYLNGGDGISAGVASTINSCTLFDNVGNGLITASGCIVTSCTAFGNSGNGISVASGCTISGCTANSNSGNGFVAQTICVITGCTARLNGLDGIEVGFQCIVRSNVTAFNGNGNDGAGIHATGSDNRIEDNACASADRGIDVDTAGNIIIKNTCSGNTINWRIAANNVYGPILDRTAPASAAVSGNAATSAIGSFDANANFTY